MIIREGFWPKGQRRPIGWTPGKFSVVILWLLFGLHFDNLFRILIYPPFESHFRGIIWLPFKGYYILQNYTLKISSVFWIFYFAFLRFIDQRSHLARFLREKAVWVIIRGKSCSKGQRRLVGLIPGNIDLLDLGETLSKTGSTPGKVDLSNLSGTLSKHQPT